MPRTQSFLAITTLMGIMFTGCVPAATQDQTQPTLPAEEQTQNDTITIGAIAPLTGDAASYGVPLQRVMQYASEKLNEKGGINGKKLEIIWEDGKCNGKDGSAAANKLINNDKVKVILGGFCSSETLAAAPLAETAKVILFSAGSSSPEITKAGDFVFRNWPSDSGQSRIIAKKAVELGLNKVAFISEKQDYTVGILNAFKENFSGEIFVEEYLSTDADFKTQLTKLKSQNPDALFINPQTPDKADLILKQVQELDFKPKQILLNDVATNYEQLTTKYATYLEGAIGADVGVNSEHPEFKALQEYYQKTYGENVPYTSYSATEYDAVFIIAEAIAQVGDVENTTAIRDYLYSIKERQGLGGNLTIDKNGEPESGHTLKVIKEGKAMWL